MRIDSNQIKNMHSVIVSMLVLINISLLFALPWPLIQQVDELQDQYNMNDAEILHLTKRLQLTPWLYKRSPALCDHRLQLRPLPLTSALCAYGW
jgi:hypothetical protein